MKEDQRMQVNLGERIEIETPQLKKEDCNARKCVKEKGLVMRHQRRKREDQHMKVNQRERFKNEMSKERERRL